MKAKDVLYALSRFSNCIMKLMFLKLEFPYGSNLIHVLYILHVLITFVSTLFCTMALHLHHIYHRFANICMLNDTENYLPFIRIDIKFIN